MKNVVWQDFKVSRENRESLLGQKAVLLWFTGLSGSGKSAIANELQRKLLEEGRLSYILDGDNIRHGLSNDLGFSAKDREENIRRVGEAARLFVDAGIITIVAFISPFRKDRDAVRKKLGKDFVEIFVKCPLEECERRDSKGFYKKARDGVIDDFTGISSPYEEPLSPELVIDTSNANVEESAAIVYNFLRERKII